MKQNDLFGFDGVVIDEGEKKYTKKNRLPDLYPEKKCEFDGVF